MKNIGLKFLLLAFAVVMSATVSAVPAIGQLLKIVQKDNRPLSFYLYGDEKLSYGKTTDGYTVVADARGVYCYAVYDLQGNVTPSVFAACDEDYRTSEEKEFVLTLDKNIFFSSAQTEAAKQKYSVMYKSYPTTGQNPLLVILVNFKDRAFTNTQQSFANILSQPGYSDNGATGSVKDYYYDNSFGQLELNPTVVGPFTLSHNMAYYGATGETFSDCNPKAMISEACQLADSIIDFTQFDVNNDGVIDAVHIIFAGIGESSSGETDAIWPHRWSIYDSDTVLKYFDGVRLKDYSCSAEKKAGGNIDGIGTLCHEFGHVLGLPDYYDADYGASGGTATALNKWSIMASGSYNNGGNTPPIFNANERMQVNWFKPDTLKQQGYYSVAPLIDSNKAYLLTTDNEDDFYLIENRSLSSWDTFLPNKGLLIYHIKSPMNHSCVNCNPQYQRCDIVEADNDDSPATLASDVFTYAGNPDYFTSYGEPYCFQWGENKEKTYKIDKPITRIYMDTTGTVSFRYLIPDTAAIIKTLNEAKSISSTSFELKGYLVYQGVEQNLSCGFMLSSSQEFDNAVFCAASNVQNDTFFYTAANLQYGTNYYYKALAVNSLSDTVWGDVYSFQTPTGLPFISLSQPSDITLDGFTLTVKKLLDGDTPITEYGVQYDTVNTFSDPVKDTVFEGGLTLQTVVMTGLQQATEYYCRAYAVNSVGVKYSSVVKAKTKFIPIENNYIGEDPEESCPNVLDYVITTQDVSGGLGDFKYFWQQRSSASQWQDAQGQNNARDYHVQNLDNDTYFRRIVFSENIKDTSNTVYAKVNASIGGNLTFKDTVMKETPQTLKLKNYKGKIVQWEEYVDNQWQTAEMSDSVASLQMSWYTAGDKAVRVKVQNQDCPASYSDTAMIFVCPSESIEQTQGQNAGFVVYPNPASESITVSSDKEEIRSYTVYTSDGRICERKSYLNQNQLILDLSSYSDNVYFININDRYTQSFVVKH